MWFEYLLPSSKSGSRRWAKPLPTFRSQHCSRRPLRLEPLEDRVLLSTEIVQAIPPGSASFRPSDVNWTVVLESVVNWVDQNIWGGGGGGGDAPGPGGGGSVVTISHANDGGVIAQTGNPVDPTLLGALLQIQGSQPLMGKMIAETGIPGKTSVAENSGTPVSAPMNPVSLRVISQEGQNNPVNITDAVFQQWETKSI
jgi:hypothetical protein